MNNIYIREGTIEIAVALSLQIPVFHQPYQVAEYEKRLSKVPHLILVAYQADKAVGFKVGYERKVGMFYSWMGGVLPTHRRLGIARKLAVAQEEWAKTQGYPNITFKTLNRHRAMLQFAIQNGFDIIKVDTRPQLAEYRIWLQKEF